MEESKDLKAGDTATYQIADKIVTLKPVTLGKMKKAMVAFQQQDKDTFEMMRDHLKAILDNGANQFATAEWIEDNVTMPMATRIISDMRTVNGLGENGFFQAGGAKTPSPETRDLSGAAPTPSA